jgi:four helix bundle protein
VSSVDKCFGLELQLRPTIAQFVVHVRKAEFIAKVGVVVEEADETVFWLELLVETGIVKQKRLEELLLEANELLAISAASQRTAKLSRK